MEKEINIAEILKDKPQGTKLYDLLYNVDVELDTISTTDTETVVWCTNETDNNTTCHRGYSEFGTVRGCHDGLQILLPSKEMRDWSKFSWKKGDVLVSNDGEETIFFDRFTDDTYTKFVGKYVWGERVPAYRRFSEKEETLLTKNYSLEENKENIKKHILTVEACILKAGLNLETLETIPLKDGDIYFCKTYGAIKIGIFKSLYEDHNEVYISNYVYYRANADTPYLNYSNDDWVDGGIYRPATNEEKQQLFEALTKEGKAWDAEKKQVVDLKPKCEFKPFDRCIWKIRNCEGSIWQASFVSYVDEYGATPMGMSIDEDLVNLIILPYNDQTKLLVGTTDEWKGGEQ